MGAGWLAVKIAVHNKAGKSVVSNSKYEAMLAEQL